MSRTAHAEAVKPAENELLHKLDKSLRERAEKMVADALDPVESRVINDASNALAAITGQHFRAHVVHRLNDAFGLIHKAAADIAYRGLTERVTAQLTDGKPVDLT